MTTQLVLGSAPPTLNMKQLFAFLCALTMARAGDLLLVVENSLNTNIAPALEQYIQDVQSEGWNVEKVTWPARNAKDTTAHVRLARDVVWPRAKKSADLHVLLVGKLPMPYSGVNLWPDGHPDSCGAYATTVYYGCPDGKWTDSADNSGYRSRTAQVNKPGDGKFDQQVCPGGTTDESKKLGKLQASIGFLDLSGASGPKAWGSTLTAAQFEIQCLNNYFKRLHDYRTGGWTVKTLVGNSSYLKRPTGYFQDWATSTVGTNNFRFFCSETSTKTQPYTLNSISAFGVVYDFKWVPYTPSYWATRTAPWAVLDLSYGSYQIDFNSQRLVNPLVSSTLATANSAIGAWDLNGAFEGKTLGQLWYQTVNRGLGNMYCVLYGDPTLRILAK